MHRRGNTFIKSGAIYLNDIKKESGHTLVYSNKEGYIDTSIQIALKEIGFRFDENLITDVLKRNITITCSAVNSRAHVLRSFVLPPFNNDFYCETRFEELYFAPVNKIYPELEFVCNNRDIFLDRIVVLYKDS